MVDQYSFIRYIFYNRVPECMIDDLTQDTVLRCIEKPPPVYSPESRGWVRTIAQRIAADWWRDTNRRWEALPKPRVPQRLDYVDDDTDNPVIAEQLTAREFDRELEARDSLLVRLSILPERQQRAMWLVGAGYSVEEIGRELNCAPRAVDAVVFRARDRIRREFQDAA